MFISTRHTAINNMTSILPTELTATALTIADALSSITNKQCILLMILKKLAVILLYHINETKI